MTKKIVGIRYEPALGAPKVTVKAAGPVAEKIVEERSRAEDLRLVKNKELLDSLFAMPLDSSIDESLFEVVAVLLVHIYTLDAERMKQLVK